VFATTAIAAADDHSFVGTWKLNLEKSHLTGETFTRTKLPSGMLHYSRGSVEFDYQYDGKAYEIEPGITGTWTKSGENSWNWTENKDGKALAVGNDSLSKDGNTLKTSYTFYRPDGRTDTNSSVYKRVSGGPGILGTWKSTKENYGAAWTQVIEMPAPDEVSWSSPEGKQSWHGKCDGSEIADQGPLAIKGNTSACKLPDARTMEWTFRLNGKVTGMQRMTLSADARSMEVVSWTPGKESEKTIGVWDRQ
jgi:hypothetical protein